MALMLMLMPAIMLFLFAIVVNELLKLASQTRNDTQFHCRKCGRRMEQVQTHWSYQFPFEIWVVTNKRNLPHNTVKRYMCPERHTQAWYVPVLGDWKCDVLVTKDF